MTDRDLHDGNKSNGGARDENETHRGWKSKWVETTSAPADAPLNEKEMKGKTILDNDAPSDGAEGTN